MKLQPSLILHLLTCLLVPLSLTNLRAQSLAPLEESLTYSSAGYQLDWNGVIGYTYFVQCSSNLKDWTYLPFVEPGAGVPMKYEFGVPSDTLFVRLIYSDAPQGGMPDDFDGDGIRDLTEIYFGFDPVDPSDAPADLDSDIDGDGWHDFYETLFGRSPAIPEETQLLQSAPKTSLRVFTPVL